MHTPDFESVHWSVLLVSYLLFGCAIKVERQISPRSDLSTYLWSNMKYLLALIK